MKNLILAAAAALGLLVSCNKEENEIYEPSKGTVVTVSFTDEDPATRVFFEPTAAAEPWEKALNTVTMFVFDSSGDLLVKRAFSYAELTAKKATFVLPDVFPGVVCEFYAVANLDVAAVKNKDMLLNFIEHEPAAYNGTFAEVSTQAKRARGFVMSGMTSHTIQDGDYMNNVAIALKRTVAKFAVQTMTSPAFAANYKGRLIIKGIQIYRAATQARLFDTVSENADEMNYTTRQWANLDSDKYQNIFYLYEAPVRNAGNRVLATIHATYDLDGDTATSDDQTNMTYEIELNEPMNGAIVRNSYYLMNIVIDGFSRHEASLTITPAEWEPVAMQEYRI